VDHRDLHSDNVLVEETGSPGGSPVRFIDFHSARLHRMGRRRRLRALTKLAFSLGRDGGRTDVLRVLRAYRGGPGGARRSERRELRRILHGIDRLETRRLRSRSRRCVVPSTRFRVEAAGGFRVYRRAGFPRPFLEAAIERHRRCLRDGGEALVKEGRTNRITRFALDLDGEPVAICVKEYRERKPLDRLKFLLGRRRGLASWKAAHGLDVRGVRTAEGLGLFLPRRGGSQYLVMRDMVDWTRLDRLVLTLWPTPPAGRELARKHGFNRQLALFFRDLHDRGIYHGDTKATNVLVRAGASGHWEFLLVDTDRVVFRSRTGMRRRVKNLAQLHASIPTSATRTDRFRFFRTYATDAATPGRRKAYYRAIDAECRSKQRVGANPIE
jgi:hypothetical protein